MSIDETKKFSSFSGKGSGFLLVVILLYGLVAYSDVELARRTAKTFINILVKILPVLGLVFLLIFVSNLVLSPKKVKTFVGAGSGLKGWVLAIFSGILSTGPVYPWYALLADLGRQGMKRSLIAVFLYSRAVKLPLIPLLIHYFSFSYTLVLSLYLIVFSVVTGLLMERLENKGALAADSVGQAAD